METAITNSISSTTAEVTSVLTGNLPEIFTVFAGLLALAIIVRLIGRLIGGRA